MCLAAACKIEGTLPHSLATKNASDVRIGNPSGVLSVGAEVIREDGEWTTLLTRSYRTQRRLMEGMVLVPA